MGSSCYLIDFEGNLWTFGSNNHGQLGTGDKESVSIAKEMNSQYSTIWKDEVYTRSKSARK